MDTAITAWINGLAGQHPGFDQVMVVVTSIGVPLMVFLVLLLWWSRPPRKPIRHSAVAAGLSFLLGLAIAQIMLLFVHRLRPYDAGVSHLIIAPTVDWSFPSDHAIASLSIAFAFTLQGFHRWSVLFFCMAAIICFSRIYVGMHYASDILGGAGVAIMAAIAIKVIYRTDTKLDGWITSFF